MTTDEAAYAVQSVMDSLCDEVVQCGHWVRSIVPDIIKAFTNALFETHWNLANESAL